MTTNFAFLLHLIGKYLAIPQDIITTVNGQMKAIINSRSWKIYKFMNGDMLLFYSYGSGLYFNCSHDKYFPRNLDFCSNPYQYLGEKYTIEREEFYPLGLLRVMFKYVENRIASRDYPLDYWEIKCSKNIIETVKILRDNSDSNTRRKLEILIPILEMRYFINSWLSLHGENYTGPLNFI